MKDWQQINQTYIWPSYPTSFHFCSTKLCVICMCDLSVCTDNYNQPVIKLIYIQRTQITVKTVLNILQNCPCLCVCARERDREKHQIRPDQHRSSPDESCSDSHRRCMCVSILTCISLPVENRFGKACVTSIYLLEACVYEYEYEWIWIWVLVCVSVC